jgi:NhaP-type Na+/H+ and K+/H+ antiporter
MVAIAVVQVILAVGFFVKRARTRTTPGPAFVAGSIGLTGLDFLVGVIAMYLFGIHLAQVQDVLFLFAPAVVCLVACFAVLISRGSV